MPGKHKTKSCRPLRRGGKIGVVATGSPVQPERLSAGVGRLAALGYQVEMPLDPSKFYGRYEYGFTNGSPADRAAAFMQLIEDPSVDAIFAARGGYGSLDILSLIDFEKISRSRKPIVGYSDFTALLAAIHSETGLAVVHGPTVSKEFAESGSSPDASSDVDWLLGLLSGELRAEQTLACSVLDDGVDRPPSAVGPALPGNLVMLQSLLGTPWDLSFDGAVVVFEEIGEQPYRVHRALTQLALAGKFERAAAVVFGRFSNCESKNGPTIEEVLRSASATLVPAQVPVFFGLPFGHNGMNRAIPFGISVEIGESGFTLKEDVVAV